MKRAVASLAMVIALACSKKPYTPRPALSIPESIQKLQELPAPVEMNVYVKSIAVTYSTYWGSGVADGSYTFNWTPRDQRDPTGCAYFSGNDNDKLQKDVVDLQQAKEEQKPIRFLDNSKRNSQGCIVIDGFQVNE